MQGCEDGTVTVLDKRALSVPVSVQVKEPPMRYIVYVKLPLLGLQVFVLKNLGYPATPSSSHGFLQQRRQQHWTTAVPKCIQTTICTHRNAAGT